MVMLKDVIIPTAEEELELLDRFAAAALPAIIACAQVNLAHEDARIGVAALAYEIAEQMNFERAARSRMILASDDQIAELGAAREKRLAEVEFCYGINERLDDICMHLP